MALPPTKQVPWKLPSGPLSEPEKTVSGTWMAMVDDVAPRSALRARQVMFDLRGTSGGPQGVAEAIVNDQRLQTNCVWLELNADRTGIRRECGLSNGAPASLEVTDPQTGAKQDLGTTFEWYWDSKLRSVRIRYDADMFVPAKKGETTWNLRFRVSHLKIGDADGKGFKIRELLPEHDYELPTQYTYEIFSGRFTKKK